MSFSAQTYFRNTTNSFTMRRTLQETGIMVHEFMNANSQKSYGVELGMDFTLARWWQLSTGGSLYHYTLDAQTSTGETSRSTNSWDARIINNFTLNWGAKIQAVGYMRGPQIDAQGENDGFYTVNLGINQPLMKGKVNVGISAENIFDTIKFDYSTGSDNYDAKCFIASEGMVLRFTASYTFNNFKSKQRGRADDANFKGGGAF